MSLLPFKWSKLMGKKDFPEEKDVGKVLGTQYKLILSLRNSRKRNSQDLSHQVLDVQIERFLDLSSSTVFGSISICDQDFKRCALKAFQHSFIEGESVFSFDMTFRRPNIMCGALWHMEVCGQISIDLPKDTDTDSSYISSSPASEMLLQTSLSHLSRDFRYMLENDTFSDVTLKCGDATLFAHKAILSSRSPVFKAMFSNDMREAHSKEIVIPDVTPTAIKSTLNYIYCAKTEDFDEKSACELLYAADKYELLELKESCVSYLKGIISDENVSRILEVAALHDESFKKSAVAYIWKNFPAIEKSEGWISLKRKNPDLVMEVLSCIVNLGLQAVA